MPYDALILAGGPPDPRFDPFGSAPNKVFLPLGDRLMVEYVAEAFVNSEAVRQLYLVAPPVPLSPRTNGMVAGVIQGGGTLFDSLSRGLRGIPTPTSKVLVAAGDLPLLTPKKIDHFVSHCEEYEADLYYPFVERSDSEARFPHLPHTWVYLREGTFCGGGMVLLSPARFTDLSELARKATRYRKNPWRLTLLFGVGNMIKFLLRRLSVVDLERTAAAFLGFPVKGIRSADPEIAFNVDDPEGFRRAAAALGVPLPGTPAARD